MNEKNLCKYLKFKNYKFNFKLNYSGNIYQI